MIEGLPAVRKEIVVWVHLLDQGQLGIDVDDLCASFFLDSYHDIAVRCHDLAFADEVEALAVPYFVTGTVGRNYENTILDGAGDHGIRAIGRDEIRAMQDYLSTFER